MLKDGAAYAVCYAALHDHAGVREAWLDVIFGTWSDDPPDDHVTFGCRVGPIEGQSEPAASLVTGGIPFGDSPLFGRKLSRDEEMVDPRLPQFWEVVDFVLVTDPDVHAHVYAGEG